MNVLEHLEPKSVFRFFEEMCAIPHGSRNTKAVSDWCADFARARGLEYHQDGDNNIIIIKEAAPGYEAAPPVILQGHLDMVCEQTADCQKDMSREGLDLAVDGDFVYAKGTTLGGDDGIAVAMALALLDAEGLPHPRLEAVFTVDEEIGLLGAASIDVTPLKGRQMLNLDSEAEGIFTVSCAGGNTSACLLPLTRAPFDGAGVTVAVGGLTGLKDNAIPVACTAQVVAADPQAVLDAVREMEAALRNEYRVTDPALWIRAEASAATEEPMDERSTRRVLCMLACLPNGVQAMSAEIHGLVQTSLNLGILATEETSLRASFCVRSSVDSQREMLKDRLTCLMEELGGTVEFAGWQYREDSPLRDRMVEVFREQYGKEPKIEAIHAGLECGVFAGKLPGLDCVSIGPDLFEIHTPRERLSISSVQRIWDFVVEVLKRSK